jgi:NADPH:quinone reductase-like Zn-dependent oxidoreductase
MKAAYILKHGDLNNLIVGDLDKPNIREKEIIIETRFSALNHIDLFIIKGWLGLDLKMPHILGSDASGIVVEVGSSVTTVKKGDRVAINPGLSCGTCDICLSGKQNFCKNFSIMGEHQWGTHAEYFVVPEVNAIKLPLDVRFEIAAAAPLTFLTAWRALKTQARLQYGETIFIHGAGGGVSSAAIQIAKLLGATVITTTSSAKKVEIAKKLGANFVINYKENPNYDVFVYKNIMNREGVDVVLDSVGKETFEKSLRLLKPGGRLITPGSTTGPKSEVDLRQIFWKQLEIKGTTMSNQSEFRDVMKLIFNGKLNPIIDKIYPLNDIKEAEEHLQEGKQFGKVLLKVKK